MNERSVFISYSHKDELWKDRLVEQLGVLEDEGLLATWDDRRINASDDWRQEILHALENCKAAVLLVSAAFLRSNFIRNVEIPKLIERRSKERLIVIPAIVSACPWQKVEWLARIQARPQGGRPLSSFRGHRRDEVLASIATEVLELLQREKPSLESVLPIRKAPTTIRTNATAHCSDVPACAESESSCPDPPATFPVFTFGNIRLPVAVILGTPMQPIAREDVTIRLRREVFEESQGYPPLMAQAHSELLETIIGKYRLTPQEANDLMPRLNNVVQGREKPGDQRGEIIIDLSLTTFGRWFTTNCSLDAKVISKGSPSSGSRKTIRESYCLNPLDLSTSVLANPVGVDVCLISRNPNQIPHNQFILRKRSNQILLDEGCHQVADTGYMSLAHTDSSDCPSPFVTAIVETQQEVGDALDLSIDDFKLLGIAIKWEDLHASFFGFIESSLPASEIVSGFRRDAYEGSLSAIPFTPTDVLTHICSQRWHAASALAAIGSLRAYFPLKEVRAVASTLHGKPLRSFYRCYEGQK